MKYPDRQHSKWTALTLAAMITVTALAPAVEAQQIQQIRGVDSRVDYVKLTRIGPWDDRNYQLTEEDLELLADNERELRAQIPAFFRVEMRQQIPEMRRTGPVQYPRSALQAFRLTYSGYLVDGKIYNQAEHRDSEYVVLMEGGVDQDEYFEKFLNGEVRVTSPNGGAESAIKVNPVNTDLVVAGANGPGSGQSMHYSTDGGETWNVAASLPGGGTCCDPTVDWSSDGSLAYTATLGNCGGSGCQIWFYRSSNGGQTWTDLSGSPARRTLSTGGANDKEFIHVDKHASSPFKDNIYATWHSNNTLVFSRSTDFGNTWSRQNFSSSSDQLGIGSDITTDENGHVYYFWPAFNSRRILLRKSTDGGASFGAVIEVDATEASFAFPVPSMETREVFVYVSADADLSNGPFGGSVYAAWTDSTSSTGSNANNNHARIQVAYSRNGGNTWTVTTPHETADANSVDRWHQWLAVDPCGRVHVVFYDTRIGNRTTVDLFYSFSDDGAQTWSTPTRVTTQQSPNIGDSFEFGDYNGLDVVMQDLIAIFTDNRAEGGGGGDSVDVYAAGIPVSCGGGGNTAPQVTISTPADGSSFPEGTSIAFAGTATDAEDGDLTASLAWTSNLDGAIGSGGSFSAVLSAGTHTVTATVTDSGGLQGSSSITVTVTVSCQGVGGLVEDFEGGLGAWTTGGLWHLVSNSTCAPPGYSSAVSALYYGQNAGCSYDTGAATSGDLISPQILGILASSTLNFDYFRQVEGPTQDPYDVTEVAASAVGDPTWTTVWTKDSRDASENAWTPSGAISLAAFDGQTIQLRFRFDSTDELFNDFVGWSIDDVVVTGDCGPGNTAPVVTITAPADGSSFPGGSSIAFAGSASDAEDGDLTAGLAWTSSLDGAIGTGGSFNATLSAGTHTVTAAITDSGGLPGSSSITVTVIPAPAMSLVKTGILDIGFPPGGIALVKTGALDQGPDGQSTPGDLITYTFDVTNSGASVLSNVTVSDPLVPVITCPSGAPARQTSSRPWRSVPPRPVPAPTPSSRPTSTPGCAPTPPPPPVPIRAVIQSAIPTVTASRSRHQVLSPAPVKRSSCRTSMPSSPRSTRRCRRSSSCRLADPPDVR